MELAIPLIALGGLYVASNQNQNNTKPLKKENFNNMGTVSNLQVTTPQTNLSNYLPNTNVPPSNYPIMDNKQLVSTVQEYPNPNQATDKYFNQNAYELKARNGQQLGSSMQQIYSLTGDYMSSDEFKHNNMVPFTGRKAQGQIYNNNNAETLLDNYVGNGSQVIKKIEQAPLFKPQDNVQWTYGMPNVSEFIMSRQNPVNKNNMVKPFESIRVGPGLDQGYTSAGSLGYNSGMEARDKWLPKTVDELRVATNPKQEYTLDNLQGPAQSYIKNIGIEGKMEKNRPDTFFINSQDRWLTTTGAEKAGRVIADEVLKNSVRNETTTYQQGTPNAVLKTASYVPTAHEETKRVQLEGFEPGHSVATCVAPFHNDKDNHHKSHTNYANNRSINSQPQTFGSGFASAIGAVIAPIMDILKPSRKEEYSCNMRVYGNMVGEVPSNYVLTPGDVPGTTVKETTLYQPNTYIGNQSENAAYLVTDHQPITNQRDTTCQVYRPNGMSSKYGVKSYEADYRQTNNESKEKLVVNRMNSGNAKLHNSNVNVSMSRLDSDRENNRLWAPSSVIPMGPSAQTYGHIAHMPQQYNPNQGCDRISPDLLTAFKENPFTQSLHSVA